MSGIYNIQIAQGGDYTQSISTLYFPNNYITSQNVTNLIASNSNNILIIIESPGTDALTVGGYSASQFVLISQTASMKVASASFVDVADMTSFIKSSQTSSMTVGTASHLINTNSVAFINKENIFTAPQIISSSLLQGIGIVTSSENQFICGRYNNRNNDSIFIVGNGTNDSNRNDILSITTSSIYISGSINISGSLFVNGKTVEQVSPLLFYSQNFLTED